jgi:hypothetical protein
MFPLLTDASELQERIKFRSSTQEDPFVLQERELKKEGPISQQNQLYLRPGLEIKKIPPPH